MPKSQAHSPSIAACAALAAAIALWSSPPAPALAQSPRQADGGLDTSGPISISADHMTADDSRRIVTFTGRVVARQGDLIISCDTMRVNYQPVGSYRAAGAPDYPGADAGAPPEPARQEGADAPQALPPAAPPAGLPEAVDRAAGMDGGDSGSPSRRSPLEGGQEIDRVEAEGAVKIQQGDRMAVANRALYLAKALPRRLVLTGEARVWQGQNSITGYQITYYLDENRSLVDSQGSRRVRAFYDQGAKR